MSCGLPLWERQQRGHNHFNFVIPPLTVDCGTVRSKEISQLGLVGQVTSWKLQDVTAAAMQVIETPKFNDLDG